jgi:hypothetical protein
MQFNNLMLAQPAFFVSKYTPLGFLFGADAKFRIYLGF